MSESGFSPENFQEGAKSHFVNVEQMDKDVESVLARYLSGDQLAEAQEKIKTALESSATLAEFSEKFDSMYKKNFLQGTSVPNQPAAWDQAFHELRAGFMSLFTHYFAEKEGYQDYDTYMAEKHGLEVGD